MMKKTIKQVIREYAPEWEDNKLFILNVETLYENYSDDYEDEDSAEVVNGFYKDAIIDAINASICDYEYGETDF